MLVYLCFLAAGLFKFHRRGAEGAEVFGGILCVLCGESAGPRSLQRKFFEKPCFGGSGIVRYTTRVRGEAQGLGRPLVARCVWANVMFNFLDLGLDRREKAILLWILAASVVVWGLLIVHVAGSPEGSPAVTVGVVRERTVVSLDPTATFTPSPTPTVAVTHLVSPTPTSTPTPVAPSLIPLPSDTVVFALLGTDEDRSAGVWRTDTLILVFVVASKKRLALLSVPRDLWVQIPGYGYGRINTVDALGERTGYTGGGPALLDETLRQNLGLWIDHYVRVDFQDFVRLVDAMGGVMVYVDRPIHDRFPDPFSPTGEIDMELSVGMHHMDGHMALCYCRSRMTTSDFDRSRRQQQVLIALWKKALTFGVLKKVPQLWRQFSGSFDTDLTPAQALQLASLARDLDTQNIYARHLDFSVVRPWTTPGGARVLLADRQVIQQIVLELVSGEDE